jgi:hypothetical protein
MSNARKIIQLLPGVHEPLISRELWEHNQKIREQKLSTPTNTQHPRREYALTGTGHCAECFEFDGRLSSLRGSTGGTGARYYRCADLQDRPKQDIKRRTAGKYLTEIGIRENHSLPSELADLHRGILRADQLEFQVNLLMERVVILPEWREELLAAYLGGEGMAAYDREKYNLTTMLARYRDLFKMGHIGKAEYESKTAQIARQLKILTPSSKPEARLALPLLDDFPALWRQLTSGEKRSLLRIVFDSLFFDATGRLVKFFAHEPFEVMMMV